MSLLFPKPWRPETHAAAIAALPDRHSLPAAYPSRSTRKAVEWGAAIYRAYNYLSKRIREPSHHAELDALLEKMIADGPGFAKVRGNASFGTVKVVAFTGEAAAKMMKQFRQIERETYAKRPKGAHGGALGRMAERLLEWFCYRLWPKSPFGMTPSIAEIAEGARMSRTTVITAMGRLERFGFLGIERRRKIIQTLLGSKVVQATNAYTLGLPGSLGALAPSVLQKKCPMHALKPAGFSESTSSPAYRDHNFPLGAKRQDWFPQPDYKPLLT